MFSVSSLQILEGLLGPVLMLLVASFLGTELHSFAVEQFVLLSCSSLHRADSSWISFDSYIISTLLLVSEAFNCEFTV